MSLQTFSVDGLRCAGCVDNVTQAFLALDGISSVDVALETAAPSAVRIEADHDVDPDRLQAALSAIGDFRIRN